MDPEKVDHFVTDGVSDTLKLGGACGGSCREKKGCCLEPIDIKKYKTLKLSSCPLSLLSVGTVRGRSTNLSDSQGSLKTMPPQLSAVRTSHLKTAVRCDTFDRRPIQYD